LANRTVAIMGPEQMPLSEAVRRVARAVGRRPLIVPAPLLFHRALAVVAEATMTIPLASRAQVRILAESLVEPWAPFEPLPADLQPTTPFSDAQIRERLPAAGGFRLADFRRAKSGQ
jgi:hypothetical protein